MGRQRSRPRIYVLVCATLLLVSTVCNVKLSTKYRETSLELSAALSALPTTRNKVKGAPLMLSVPFYVYEELAWMNATYGGEPVREKSRGRLNKHFNDYYFAKASLTHPLRTRDPSQAKLFVVPILMNFFDDKSYSKKQLCWNNKCDKQLLKEAGKLLQKSPWFQEYSHLHIATTSHYAYGKDFWESAKPRMLRNALYQCNVISYENRGFNSPDRLRFPSYLVGTPCPLQGKKEFHVAMVAALNAPFKPNNHLFEDRRNICQWIKDKSLVNVTASNCGKGQQCSALADAQFGFHARGDTFGSSRLMDTLLSGTVPIFTRVEQYHCLPKWINWTRISYFVPVDSQTNFANALNEVIHDKLGYRKRRGNNQGRRKAAPATVAGQTIPTCLRVLNCSDRLNQYYFLRKDGQGAATVRKLEWERTIPAEPRTGAKLQAVVDFASKMMRSNGGSIVGALLGLLALCRGSHAFYLPGVNPNSFEAGDKIELFVNKMTSTQNLLPVEYYRLGFCQPVDLSKEKLHENLGEFLAGDRIEKSPYVLKMKRDTYCEQLCVVHNLGAPEKPGLKANKLVQAIRKDYHNNWIVDNLSSAAMVEDDKTVTTTYSHGFPVGFIAGDPSVAYVHNHVNIEIMFHPVKDKDSEKYRVVRFTVEPFSIKHEFKEESKNDDDDDVLKPEPKVTITNPIESCKENIKEEDREHTSYDMVTDVGRYPQEASGKALFTYDVIWKKNENATWATRWDTYLASDNGPKKVHWLSIANSLVIVSVLSLMIVTILLKNLRQDLARYNRIPTDEEKADELEERGWKLVHADVFRPPSFSPLLLSVACGTGAQLLCMTFWTIVFSTFGFLSPAKRGALLMAELAFFVLMGIVAGFVTARMYKTFKGKAWQYATLCTALGFPGICFTMFFIMDIMAWWCESTDAVPFSTILVLLLMWFGVSTPLVFLGAYYGYKQDAFEIPVKTSSIPRQIPDQPWFMGAPFTVMIGGILPFGACYVELYFILASVWKDSYYYVFGVLLLVFFILIITCAEITLLFNYFQLCNEDYHWWWRSFGTAGSTAIYVFLYSFVYFQNLHASSMSTYVLYFGYMGLASLGLCLMTGFIGVASCFWFNKTIFQSVKFD
eukprot:scaffold4634_cov122-Cylindrotheca_fusiformis.AAC.1